MKRTTALVLAPLLALVLANTALAGPPPVLLRNR